MSEEITVKINLDTTPVQQGVQKATAEVQKLGKATEDTNKNLKNSAKESSAAWSTFKGVIGAQGVLMAVNQLAAGAKKLFDVFIVQGIDAAQRQQAALQKAAIAMEMTGENTAEARKAIEKWSGAMQDATGLGDEVAVELFALAKNFGLTNDEALKTVEVANDVAAAMGIDVRTAVEQLGGTFNGVTGRLAKLNPELGDLSKEALASGKAIELLGKQFAGQAASRLDTYAGGVEALKGRFGDLQEEFGNLIIKSPAVNSLISDLSQYIKELTSDLANGGLDDFNEVVSLLAAGLRESGKFAAYLANEVKNLSVAINGSVKEVEDLGEAYEKIKFSNAFVGPLQAHEELQKTMIQEQESLKDIVAEEEKRKVEVEKQNDAKAKQQVIDKRLADDRKKAAVVALAQQKKDEQALVELKSKYRDEDVAWYESYVAKQSADKKQLAEETKRLSEETNAKLQADADLLSQYQLNSNKAWSTEFQNFMSGGIKSVVGNAVSGLTDVFLPGFGAAAGQAFNILSQDADTFLQTITQMFDTQFIKNIASNIRILIQKLPELIGPAIQAIIEALPAIAGAFTRMMLDPGFQWNLAKSITLGLVNGVINAAGQIANELGKIFSSAGSLISRLFQLPDSAWGRGTVESALGIDIPFVRFAEGGTVPGKAKVKGDSPANDTVLAWLSPGEAVIPRSAMANPQVRGAVKQILSGQIPGHFLGSLGDAVTSVGDWVGDRASDVWSGVKQGVSYLGEIFGSPWEMIKKHMWGWLRGGLGLYSGGIVPRASYAIPGYASGGMVAGPSMAPVSTGSDTARLEARLNQIAMTIATMQQQSDIVVQIDGREVARAARRVEQGGFNG